MNAEEQFEITSYSAEWLANEAETLLEKYNKSSSEKQVQMLPKIKHIFARLKFEGKQIRKYINES